MAHLLSVTDLERSRVFYHQLLRLPCQEQPQPDGSLQLRIGVGEEQIQLVGRAQLRQRHPLLFAALDRCPGGLGLLLCFVLPKLAAVVRQLAAAGMQPVYELEDSERQQRELWLYDPDHHLVCLRGPL